VLLGRMPAAESSAAPAPSAPTLAWLGRRARRAGSRSAAFAWAFDWKLVRAGDPALRDVALGPPLRLRRPEGQLPRARSAPTIEMRGLTIQNAPLGPRAQAPFIHAGYAAATILVAHDRLRT